MEFQSRKTKCLSAGRLLGYFDIELILLKNERTDRHIYLDNHWLSYTINQQNERCRFDLTEIIYLNLINRKNEMKFDLNDFFRRIIFRPMPC